MISPKEDVHTRESKQGFAYAHLLHEGVQMARKTCARLFVLTHLMKRLRKPLLHEPWNKIISQHTRIQIFVCWDFNIDWILSQLLIRFDWSQLSWSIVIRVTSASSQSAISILVTWQKWTNQRCILIYSDDGFVTSSAQLESWLAHFCHVTKILIADWLLSEVTVITTGIVLDTQRRFSS